MFGIYVNGKHLILVQRVGNLIVTFELQVSISYDYYLPIGDLLPRLSSIVIKKLIWMYEFEKLRKSISLSLLQLSIRLYLLNYSTKFDALFSKI